VDEAVASRDRGHRARQERTGSETCSWRREGGGPAIHAGEFLAVMGPPGSGKSTLMNILGCLDRPTSGRYRLDGKRGGELSRDGRAILRRSRIGFVFQGFNLLPPPLREGERRTADDLRRHARTRRRANGRTRPSPPSGCRRGAPLLRRRLSGRPASSAVADRHARSQHPRVDLADEPIREPRLRKSREEIWDLFSGLNDERGITRWSW